MLGQELARLANRMHERIGEILRFEMRPHSFARAPARKARPHFSCTPSSPIDRKLLRARRDEDQNGVALACLRHAELVELSARPPPTGRSLRRVE